METRKQSFSAQDMRSYYRSLHAEAIALGEDELSPVVVPGAPWLLNRLVDYAHKLGMASALKLLDSKMGSSWAGRSILDVGCGRGRWLREFKLRRARITGVDISPEALTVVKESLGHPGLACGDLSAIPFRSGTFDLVSSITVLQHLTYDGQESAVREIHRCLKPDGFFTVLENCADFDEAHVFARPPGDWINMMTSVKFEPLLVAFSNYEIPLGWVTRWYARRARSGRASQPVVPGFSPTRPRKGMARLLTGALALSSFPVEWCCHRIIALGSPSHFVAVFRKRT